MPYIDLKGNVHTLHVSEGHSVGVTVPKHISGKRKYSWDLNRAQVKRAVRAEIRQQLEV